MVKLKAGYAPLLAGLMFWPGVYAAEETSIPAADIEFLEFLGSMEQEADEWEAFIEFATADMPPMVAEVENES